MHRAVELSADRRFARRVVRLALTSVAALGAIWLLAKTDTHASPLATSALFGGWMLMPSTLVLSLRWPLWRYGLIVPSTLVSLGLLGVCITPPDNSWARVGWLAMTAGVWFGGILGGWLWYQWLPVPNSLSDPFSVGRWSLIGLHIGLIVIGTLLVVLSRNG